MNLKELAKLKKQVSKGEAELKYQARILEIKTDREYSGKVEKSDIYSADRTKYPFQIKVPLQTNWYYGLQKMLSAAAQELYGPRFRVEIDHHSSWDGDDYDYPSLVYKLTNDNAVTVKAGVTALRKVLPKLKVSYRRQTSEKY